MAGSFSAPEVLHGRAASALPMGVIGGGNPSATRRLAVLASIGPSFGGSVCARGPGLFLGGRPTAEGGGLGSQDRPYGG